MFLFLIIFERGNVLILFLFLLIYLASIGIIAENL